MLSGALLVLVLGLYALAVYLATGERRRTLRNVGWALILVGLTVLVARRLAGEYAVRPHVAGVARRGPPRLADRQRDPGPDRRRGDPLRRRRGLRHAPRGRGGLGDGRAPPARAGVRRADGRRLGGRRRRLSAARPLGADARAAHGVGHPAARRAARGRRRGPPQADRVRVHGGAGHAGRAAGRATPRRQRRSGTRGRRPAGRRRRLTAWLQAQRHSGSPDAARVARRRPSSPPPQGAQ